MKQSDIKRLEKAVELYKKIEVVLDKACDSIDNQPPEYFYRGEQTTYQLVREMYATAIRERKYIEGKINMIIRKSTPKFSQINIAKIKISCTFAVNSNSSARARERRSILFNARKQVVCACFHFKKHYSQKT